MWSSNTNALNAEKYEVILHEKEIDKRGSGFPCIEDDYENVAIELTCNVCKCFFYDPNDLLAHITNSISCSVTNTPKIMLSDHLCAMSASVDGNASHPCINDARIPTIFRHRLLSTFLNQKQSKEVNSDVNNIYNAIDCFKEASSSNHEVQHEVTNCDSDNLNIPQIQKVQARVRVRTHTMYKVKCSFNDCLSNSGTYSRLLHDVLDDLLKSYANDSHFENMEYRLSMFQESYDVIPQMVLCLNHVQYLSGAFKRSNAQWQKYIEKEDNTELCLNRFLKGFGGKDFSYSNFDELYDEMDELKKKAIQSSILSYIDNS